jgi:hypothetical protein
VRLLVLALAAAALWPAAARAATPRCYGAASRDAAHPCSNAKLRYRVDPKPSLASRQRGAACTRQKKDGLAEPCAFGATAARARASFALIGDSHAAHWRTGLAAVAKAKRWRGYALTRNSCPFSTAGRPLPAAQAAQCARWKRDVVHWLAHHPAVRTVYVGQEVGDVDTAGAANPFAAATQSYVDEWRTLPASVKRVVVIRDTPTARADVLSCVSHAASAHHAPGPACAQPIIVALPPDPAVAAAAQERSARFRTIDLTSFFCDGTNCFPVVGGVLVYLDQNHLTPLYVQTLAPYLRRAIDRLR